MKVVIGGKGSGKTTALIEDSARTGYYIVCRRTMIDTVMNMARELDVQIPVPLSYGEFVDRRYYSLGIKGLLIDDADALLEYISTVPVQAISVTSDVGKHLLDAEMAVEKALSAIFTNPITGDRTAYAVLQAYKEKWHD